MSDFRLFLISHGDGPIQFTVPCAIIIAVMETYPKPHRGAVIRGTRYSHEASFPFIQEGMKLITLIESAGIGEIFTALLPDGTTRILQVVDHITNFEQEWEGAHIATDEYPWLDQTNIGYLAMGARVCHQCLRVIWPKTKNVDQAGQALKCHDAGHGIITDSDEAAALRKAIV